MMTNPIALLIRPSRTVLLCFGALMLYAILTLGAAGTFEEDVDVSPVELIQ